MVSKRKGVENKMKTIQDVLSNRQVPRQTTEEIVAELKLHPTIVAFIDLHKLTDEEVMAAALELQTYATYMQKQAEGIIASGNSNLEGQLTIDKNRRVSFGYQYAKSYQELMELRDYITCYYMDEQMLKANILDFSKENQAVDLLKVIQMVSALNKGIVPTQGFFIAGDNGVGKTHLLLALAKEFYQQKIKSTVVFFPELVRDLKQNPYAASALIKKLQRTPVLMIDDIGSEMQTSFSRDEVLLPILNARMNDNKVTFFTSNLDFESLQHHFSQTQYGENEPIKAKRVMERIISLAENVTLVGENKRRR